MREILSITQVTLLLIIFILVGPLIFLIWMTIFFVFFFAFIVSIVQLTDSLVRLSYLNKNEVKIPTRLKVYWVAISLNISWIAVMKLWGTEIFPVYNTSAVVSGLTIIPFIIGLYYYVSSGRRPWPKKIYPQFSLNSENNRS